MGPPAPRTDSSLLSTLAGVSGRPLGGHPEGVSSYEGVDVGNWGFHKDDFFFLKSESLSI